VNTLFAHLINSYRYLKRVKAYPISALYAADNAALHPIPGYKFPGCKAGEDFPYEDAMPANSMI
jgi:hypothetical protein